jgi:hypothetical protein
MAPVAQKVRRKAALRTMYPPEVIESLKDCLRTIYWYKRQLRSFLENCRVPPEIAAAQSWDDPREYKAFIADKVVTALVDSGDTHLGAFRELVRRVIEMDDFSHLLREEDGRRLKREAEVNVERLRQLVTKHNDKVKEEEKSAKTRTEAAEARNTRKSRNSALIRLKEEFYRIHGLSNKQERGRKLEPFLFDLFNLFDLLPRGSFSIVGEQIDGAFEMDGNHFLLEAKWEQSPIGARELRYFKEQVESRLDNTLGLFVSMAGFTEEGIAAFQRSRPNIILMDGEDIVAVLEGFIDLKELLARKQRYASQTGEVFRRYRDIVSA